MRSHGSLQQIKEPLAPLAKLPYAQAHALLLQGLYPQLQRSRRGIPYHVVTALRVLRDTYKQGPQIDRVRLLLLLLLLRECSSQGSQGGSACTTWGVQQGVLPLALSAWRFIVLR